MGPSDLLGTMEQFSGGHMQRPSPGSCAMILYSPIFVNSDPHQAATTVTHTKRIYRNLLRKETSFVYYTSSVLRKSRAVEEQRNARLTNFRLNLTLTNSVHHWAVSNHLALTLSQTFLRCSIYF